MNKGIYLDKRTGKWYISTKVKIGEDFRTCTVRGFNSKKEADNNYTYAIEKWKREHNLIAESDEFEKVYLQFVHYRETTVTHETARRDLTQYNTYWKKIFGYDTLKNVMNRKRLSIVYDDLIACDELNSKKKYELVRSFKAFLYFCYEYRYINYEVFQDADVIFHKVKVEKNLYQTRRVIPKHDLSLFLDAIPNETSDYVLFVMLTFLGARISELLGVCFDCYFPNEKKIEIKRQLLTSGKLTNQLKTSTSYRKILLSNEICNMLNEYITNNNITTGRLFKVSHRTFHRKLRYYEDKAGIPHYTPHEFRHTKATELASRCENIEDVVYCARLLGHSPSMFMNTYCHAMSDEKGKKFL